MSWICVLFFEVSLGISLKNKPRSKSRFMNEILLTLMLYFFITHRNISIVPYFISSKFHFCDGKYRMTFALGASIYSKSSKLVLQLRCGNLTGRQTYRVSISLIILGKVLPRIIIIRIFLSVRIINIFMESFALFELSYLNTPLIQQ